MGALATPLKILAAASLWAAFCRLLLEMTGNSVPAVLTLVALFFIGFMWVVAAVGSSARDANILVIAWLKMAGVVAVAFAVFWMLMEMLG